MMHSTKIRFTSAAIALSCAFGDRWDNNCPGSRSRSPKSRAQSASLIQVAILFANLKRRARQRSELRTWSRFLQSRSALPNIEHRKPRR